MNEGPLCYLLQVDDARILLDCGWSDSFNVDDLHSLASISKQVDAVLFSHGDLDHIGAYPYAAAKLGLSCPAFATLPVHDLGHLCLADALISKKESVDFNEFSRKDIDDAFEQIVQLRYSQPYSLAGKCQGITITAYAAGHTLGGTIWKIKKGTDDVVYAVDYNHGKERHLGGALILADVLARPSLLITDAYNAQYHAMSGLPGRKYRDSSLLETIVATIQSGGSVLIPVESATRCLELTYLLETMWSKTHEILRVPLFFLTYQSNQVISAARRMLEWMGDGITALLTQERNLPFDFNHVNKVHNYSVLDKTPGPKVVLASLSSMNSGFSRQLLFDWCSKSENTVIIPDRGPPESLTRKVYDEWSAMKEKTQSPLPNLEMTLVFEYLTPWVDHQESRRQPLEGKELEEYLAEAALKENEMANVKTDGDMSAMDEDDSDLSDDDEADRITGKSSANMFDFYVKDTLKTNSFFKQSQSFFMFPVTETRRRVDDYGEVIDPMAFVSADARIAAAQAEPAGDQPLPAVNLNETRIEEEIAKIPSKYVVQEIKLDVKCKVTFIDFEGRSDGFAIRNTLPRIAPRKMILVHGTEDATDQLRTFFLDKPDFTDEIFCPYVNDMLNVSAATNIYQIKLTDSLVSSLTVAKINDYELSYVSGVIRVQQPRSISMVSQARLESGDGEVVTETAAVVPVLDILPSEHRPAHQPVIVGDLKLSEFRRKLVNNGFEAEFTSGVLIVNKTIMVRRSQQGRLVLDGTLTSDYFKVRSLMYQELAVLGGQWSNPNNKAPIKDANGIPKVLSTAKPGEFYNSKIDGMKPRNGNSSNNKQFDLDQASEAISASRRPSNEQADGRRLSVEYSNKSPYFQKEKDPTYGDRLARNQEIVTASQTRRTSLKGLPSYRSNPSASTSSVLLSRTEPYKAPKRQNDEPVVVDDDSDSVKRPRRTYGSTPTTRTKEAESTPTLSRARAAETVKESSTFGSDRVPDKIPIVNPKIPPWSMHFFCMIVDRIAPDKYGNRHIEALAKYFFAETWIERRIERRNEAIEA
ncbi:cleavage and polyadenylation specificity factor subunit 2, partial [Blyttiomyces sp. JEL0837]